MQVDERPDGHRGWRSRGYLPHFDQPDLVQMLTFRLADAMPAERRREWQCLLATDDEVRRRARIEAYLDAGYGACYLRDPRIARLVEDALLFFDGDRYRLLAWVVMPNHVHTLVQVKSGNPLDQIMHAWKPFTARRANQLIGRTGPFWQPEYFDRFIRNARHYDAAVWYIHQNPVKARLVECAEEWQFSSARYLPAPGSAGVLARNGEEAG